jgi:ABC-type Na+ efflux pump permease subunit
MSTTSKSMGISWVKRSSAWLPTALVLAVVLIAGSRIIVLSMQQRAETARVSAQAVVARSARAIESQLQAVAEHAHRAAARASTAIASGNVSGGLESLAPPDHDTFWMTAEGAVVPSGGPAAAIEGGRRAGARRMVRRVR